MGNYRKIYEEHYGPIPKDKNNRTFEVHHIDGNHNNDSLDNLLCISIQDHYDIHYKQGDWAACSAIMMRMQTEIDYKEISRLVSLDVKNRIADGTHHFLKTGPEHHSYDHTKYKFENIDTGYIVECTCNELIKIIGYDSHIYGLVKKDGRIKSVKGWKLSGNVINREIIYKFENIESNEIFEGTALEFRKKYNLNQGNISSMIKGKNKTVKHWRMLNS